MKTWKLRLLVGALYALMLVVPVLTAVYCGLKAMAFAQLYGVFCSMYVAMMFSKDPGGETNDNH